MLNLKTKFIGRECFYYKKIDSTQDEIWRRINSNNIKNGTIIISNIQTNGKGTHGRRWHTDEENNIAFSIFIEVNSKIQIFEEITIQIAKILQSILNSKYNINVEIKSPNDLIINNKKIGGILTESKVKGDIIKYFVIGIGINTNKTIFSDDIKEIATSIKNEYKIDVENFFVISEFCNKIEEYLKFYI